MSVVAAAGDCLCIGSHSFSSRLIVGTGKYASYELMREALAVSETQCVTVAVRRERLIDASGKNILDFIDGSRYTILPNTAGCFTADDAVRVARLGREILTQIEQPRRRLGEAGSAGRRQNPAARSHSHAPGHRETGGRRLCRAGLHQRRSGGGQAIEGGRRRQRDAGRQSHRLRAGSANPNAIRICLEYLKQDDPQYPVIVDAGVGTASDVTAAMELGVDGVLLNTGIAHAKDPIEMARAMRLACEAGRLAYLAGRIPKKLYATASSPTEGRIEAKDKG